MTEDGRPRRRAQDHQPRWLLPMLIVLIVLGTVSAVTTIQTARAADVATRADVDEVQELVDQIAEQTRRSSIDREVFWEQNAAVNAVICEAVVAIATSLDVIVPACPLSLPDGEGS